MLHWNAKESLGEEFTEYMAALTYAALDANATASYGDGHLAPHEWIRTAEGTILKLDAEGHSADHTWIGEQSVLWDIAGACIEWDLTSQNTALLLDVIEARGLRINLGALTFYRAAYAAFRVGLFTLGIAQISDEQQKRRFVKGLSYYQRHLSDILTTEAATAQTAR
jgi:hypothetical protein